MSEQSTLKNVEYIPTPTKLEPEEKITQMMVEEPRSPQQHLQIKLSKGFWMASS